jgi:hypothetical protein
VPMAHPYKSKLLERLSSIMASPGK